LRSGSTIRETLGRTQPTDGDLEVATAGIRLALDRGVAPTDALGAFLTSTEIAGHSDQHVHTVIGVLRVAARHGGSQAESIDRVAAAMRLRAADAEERSAHSAQARMSAHVLTVVPLAMLTLLALTDRDVRAALATAIVGACLVLGLILNGLGSFWMRRLLGPTR
jgi:tight adherence protein B